MNSTCAQILLEINRRFYADFGAFFSATRQRIQPGVRKIMASLNGKEDILDLGCGNGELARELARSGFRGSYLGLDFSLPLLQAAHTQPQGFAASFREADLTAPGWDAGLETGHYALVYAFAALHHIPGREIRRAILQKVRDLLSPGGKFIHSNWQFRNSAKLVARIQAWELAGLRAEDVDEGDSLLDWRGGGSGLRYVHHFSIPELEQLAAETGFKIMDTFYSDGEGGRLGLYQTWEAA